MSTSPAPSLQDRVAIITGGTGGIGLATALAMQASGATVILTDINAERGRAVTEQHPGLEFIAADVTDSAAVHRLAQGVLDRHGRIDVAFNNAGIAHCVPSEDCTDEEWLRVVNIDLNAVFYCCREFGKIMLAQGKGSIVNTASMSGIISNHPQPQSAYNAAKAAVIMLTKSLAGEWAKRGVRVNSISPGYINTPMTPKHHPRQDWQAVWMATSPMERIGEPEEVAPAVVYLASDSSSFVTGSNLVIDGGYTVW